MEHDQHHDAHVHGLRLVLGSILAPKRPSPPSHPGSYPASGTASPYHHWHHPGAVAGAASEHETPPLTSSPPHGSPAVPHYQPHYQQPLQHAHQPTPSMHPHLNHHHHAHPHPQPQPQPHTHTHAYGPSRLNFTHSTGSTPSESSSPSPTPSPRPATPPSTLDHAPNAYPQESAVGDPSAIKTASAADAADPKRNRFIKVLQSKSAWDAMIHGSFV